MSTKKTPLDVISEAARRMRRLGEAANTDEARRPYSDPHIDPVPEAQWGKLVNNYLGGELGEHCAAWTPAVALAIASVLEEFVEGYGVAYDRPECPACGNGCSGHELVAYHAGCDEDLDECRCVRPYLNLAEIFLGQGMFVGSPA